MLFLRLRKRQLLRVANELLHITVRHVKRAMLPVLAVTMHPRPSSFAIMYRSKADLPVPAPPVRNTFFPCITASTARRWSSQRSESAKLRVTSPDLVGERFMIFTSARPSICFCSPGRDPIVPGTMVLAQVLPGLVLFKRHLRCFSSVLHADCRAAGGASLMKMWVRVEGISMHIFPLLTNMSWMMQLPSSAVFILMFNLVTSSTITPRLSSCSTHTRHTPPRFFVARTCAFSF